MTAPAPPSTEPPDAREVFRNTLTDLLDTPPHILASLSFAELAARELNADQVVTELFQNARDAITQAGRGGARLRVELTEEAVLLANDGARIDRAGYHGLTGLSRSSKRDRGPGGGLLGGLVPGAARTLGRHGVGFKSVLQVTDRPQVFGNTPAQGRLAVEMGAPRVGELCAALARADEPACLALLDEAEREVFAQVVAPPRTLETRSLPVHLGARGVGLEDLLAALPVTPFPLWVNEVPPRVAELLGWDGAPPDDKPFDTVIRLPLRQKDAERSLAKIRDELDGARRVFMGIHVSIRVLDRVEQ